MSVAKSGFTVLVLSALSISAALASATGCEPDESLSDLSRQASVIVFGTLTSTNEAGYELVDGTLSKAAPGFNVPYRGVVSRLGIKIQRAIKGSTGSKLHAYISLPILSLGCPDRPLMLGHDAVFLLLQRSSGYWVVGGRDGVFFTGDQGLPGIIMQLSPPEVVK